MKSISPINGKTYSIPEVLDDRQNIDDFLEKNKDKKVVVVQGLGFVGAVMSLVVANALTEEYAVIGIDLPNEYTYWKIASINEGEFPVVSSDKKVTTFFEIAQAKGNLLATYDAYAYSKADVVIVDINLDVKKDSSSDKELLGYDLNLNSFKKAIQAIGLNCKSNVLVLVETTVPPGTCEKIVQPIMEDCFEQRGLSKDYKLGHSYERVMPGPNYIDSIQNFYRVFSGVDEVSKDATEKFLKTIIFTDEYPLTRLGSTNATEMAKVLENSFRAMNIAFIDEWSKFAEEAGVNLYEVVRTIRMRPTHKNLMLPGLGVGGYCLPKDPLLASWARRNLFKSDFGLPQSEKAVEINDLMPGHTVDILKKAFLEKLKGKKVVILGVSYLNDVGDTRYTPVELVYDKLKKEGCDIDIHDTHVRYWEERAIYTVPSFEKILEQKIDILILGTRHKTYINSPILKEYLTSCDSSVFIMDSQAILSEEEIQLFKEKHTVKVIGRGDI
jgi:nucleotide sugar dehydrogenase